MSPLSWSQLENAMEGEWDFNLAAGLSGTPPVKWAGIPVAMGTAPSPEKVGRPGVASRRAQSPSPAGPALLLRESGHNAVAPRLSPTSHAGAPELRGRPAPPPAGPSRGAAPRGPTRGASGALAPPTSVTWCGRRTLITQLPAAAPAPPRRRRRAESFCPRWRRRGRCLLGRRRCRCEGPAGRPPAAPAP